MSQATPQAANRRPVIAKRKTGLFESMEFRIMAGASSL
jgi:hypothetical protein